MDIRYAIHPEQMKTLDTAKMRQHFLVENLFEKDRLNMVYSHIDRIITGGVCPVNQTVALTVTRELGVDFFAVVFHLLGEPEETRHLVVRNEQAVISPSWSLHSGAGTGSYSFIWGMAGENQTFTDMDDVPMAALR